MFADGGWADMRSPGVASLLSVAVCSCRTGAALAAVCKVLSTPHPNIQDAVNDNSFTEMVVAAGTFVESVEIDRSLEITGNSSTTTMIEGGVVVTGAGVELTLNDPKVDAGASSAAGCYPVAVEVSGGASLTSSNLVAVNADSDARLIFRDGFETGDTGFWSGTTP